ncbi:two-component system response regulator [Scytonema hofmannii PCC 7110]|uniref:Two-component system response regulator n=1 Tax=Scytonema hofmannii PCC 7110 TaxID=128403 RepID=A0A139XER2_9CYAN|nr:response regulator [Scytonema hofmannii]KYC43180.1 two-component system response regulator [Scytonema hofmannii PCC 7110]
MKTKRVLVIDDESPIRDIVEIGLEEMAGWEVLKAASGREGLETAKTQLPDAILLDVMMPEMDGLATFKQLQENAATQGIPTIFMTAHMESSEQERLLRSGIQGILIKPIKIYTLVEQIREILNWRE